MAEEQYGGAGGASRRLPDGEPPRKFDWANLNLPHLIEAGRPKIAGWCILFAIVTFGLLWFLGPKETIYSYQVSQANNLLHGKLDMDPQYTKNYGVLERVLYDGEAFCFPPGDPESAKVSDARFSEDCKTYMQHSLGPAFVVLPGVLIFGVDLNQTLVSVIFAAMTAPIVFLIARGLSKSTEAQVWLTVLMIFGTIFFWVGANGGVWFFAHTTATFFLFGAIYFTVTRPNPLYAGVLLGAAFMCRPTISMTGLFFVIMFANLWLRPPEGGKSLIQRINWEPVGAFFAGVSPFVLATMAINYARFDNPVESGYTHSQQLHEDSLAHIYTDGTFNPGYIGRHPPVVFEQMPHFEDTAPYILPSWAGMAMWATTPAFLYSFFAGIKERIVLVLGGVAVGLAAAVILSRGVARAWDWGWATTEIPLGIHLLPFWAMIGAGVVFSLVNRDRLIAACWAAIIPAAFFIFNFAATGWSQFGYRYGLDFTPFLWLLVGRAIGDEIKWHHKVLITIGVLVNLMGLLWIYQLGDSNAAIGGFLRDVLDVLGDDPSGWTWVRF
ncbi:MAG TPA: hypothetical protein VIW01_04795 [Dehalococcoidia bacterium]